MSRTLSVVLVLAVLDPANRLRQGYGGPPKLHAKAEGLHYADFFTGSIGLVVG